MTSLAPLRHGRVQRLALSCGLALTLGACQGRLEQAPERLPLSAGQAANPAAPATDERQRLFLNALKEHPAPSAERAALVQTELEDARFSATAAMHAWATGNPALTTNAYGFLQNVEDLAILPAIEQPLPKDPKAAYQALLLVGDAETELRRKVLQRVNALLGDTRDLPVEPGQAGAPHRVCDEAYVALRRLVLFPEPGFKQPLATKSFFASSPAARSALIESARRAPTWQRSLDPNADVEDKPAKPNARAHGRPQLTPMQ